MSSALDYLCCVSGNKNFFEIYLVCMNSRQMCI